MTSALILLPFLSVAKQESGTRKAIFSSATVYRKLSRQCNLPAQIEPVQDKNIFMLIINYGDTGSPISTASFQTQDQLGECPPYDGVITTCIFNPKIHCSSQSQCPNGE